jgi:hypothetical protein
LNYECKGFTLKLGGIAIINHQCSSNHTEYTNHSTH